MNKDNESVRRKMVKIRKSDNEQYWKLINGNKQKVVTNISVKKLYDYFKTISSSCENDTFDVNNLVNECGTDSPLNDLILEDEILKCIKQLQNIKAQGSDEIMNEFMKSTTEVMMLYMDYCSMSSLTMLFFSTEWTKGDIIPIYKNKGNTMEPQNYRPITIVSCMGKLFTAVLNSRLNAFSETFSIIRENQTGFRKGYSTLDNIFILHNICELYY